MKKIISIFILIITFITITNVFWNKTPSLSTKRWFNLYQERVNNVCGEYRFDNNNSETIYLMGEENRYLNLDNLSWLSWSYEVWRDLEIAKNTYRKNMDWIYNCATSVSNYRALEFLKTLTWQNGELKDFENIIEQKQAEIININNQNWENWKCKINDSRQNSIIKSSVLRQTTYEMCKYNYYLEYLKEVNDNISKLDKSIIEDIENWVWIRQILTIQNNKINSINNEIENTYKTFPVAFKAYSEYENYITVNILLELVREDYLVFREQLHKTLNPINQVVYKISNAMRK